MSEFKKSMMLNQLCKCMKKKYGREKADRLYRFAQKRYTELCLQHERDLQALRHHTEGNIFPTMAIFDALLAEGCSRSQAAEETMEIFSMAMEVCGEIIRRIIRWTGIYRKVPDIFLKMVSKKYTEESGFAFQHYDLPKGHIRVDVVQCPYCRVCKELGYPEIIPIFCYSDDLTYGNMHPKIKWNRTQTIGRGGQYCDFDLSLEE